MEGNFAGSDFSLNGGGYTPASAGWEEPPCLEALGGNNSVSGIVTQSLHRHMSESTPATSSPLLSSYSTNMNNWRKKLRDIMIKQNETVMDFLMKPSTEHPTIGPVEMALRRFSVRHDVDVNAVKTLSEILSDSGQGDTIQSDIQECLSKKGKSSMEEIRAQVSGLIELYKETGEMVMECENQLKMRLDKVDKIQKRVSVIIELQRNEATEALITAMEEYVRVSFKDLGIETYYKDMIRLYQKHIALREAIQLFKTGTSLPSEPTCPICLAEPIASAIVPCGHTFCLNCTRRMAIECGICRGKIKDRLKLFMT